jgi:hypothetical protein
MKFLIVTPVFFALSLGQVWTSTPKAGPYASMGPTRSEIIYVETVFSPGDVPKNPTSTLQLWVGVSDNAARTDRVHTAFISTANNYALCNAPKGWWCMRPSVMHASGTFESDRFVAVPPYAKVRIVLRKDDNRDTWTQWTFDAESGKQAHQFSRGKGRMKG